MHSAQTESKGKTAFGLDADNPVLQDPSVQKFLWTLNGLLDGTKKLVIDSKAKRVKDESDLTDYEHTFRVEDTNVRITEGPTEPSGQPVGPIFRPGLDALMRESMERAKAAEDSTKEPTPRGTSPQDETETGGEAKESDGKLPDGKAEPKQESPE